MISFARTTRGCHAQLVRIAQDLTPLPRAGDGVTFTDWRWVYAAGVSAVPDVQAAVDAEATYWNGRGYRLSDSNVFVNNTLSLAGIVLTDAQRKFLGWMPTLPYFH